MRLDIYPNFITQDEINALNNWAELGVKNKWLGNGIQASEFLDNRFTTRFYGNRFEYPKVVIDLSNKIKSFLGLNLYPLIDGHGKDGIVVSYMKDTSDIFRHTDPKSANGLSTLRCNILTQAPKSGGKLCIEGKIIDVNVGDLHCYLASEHEHWVTTVNGNVPRILWMFGVHIPFDDWDKYKIKIQ